MYRFEIFDGHQVTRNPFNLFGKKGIYAVLQASSAMEQDHYIIHLHSPFRSLAFRSLTLTDILLGSEA